MAILFPFISDWSRDGLVTNSGQWDRKGCLLGLSRKIFSLIGVWYMRRKALFPLSPSFLLVTLSCEIINWTRDHYLAPMKGDVASTSKGGRRKGKQSLGPSCTAEPTPESPPFRLPVRVDNQISFLFKPLLVLKSATCNHTHAMLKTKQTKVTVRSYVPNYLKPRSSFLLGIIPRYTTDISDSTGPQTKLILLLCKPPLCLIPTMHRHPPGHTSQIPGGHPSPPRPSPPISHQSASYVDLTLQSAFSNSIVIVLLGDRGSSSFSRATASHGLSLPLVMYLSKAVSTSFQQGPSLSFPCLRSIKSSHMPKAAVLKAWSLIFPAQNQSLHCLISELCYKGHTSISASIAHRYNYLLVCFCC